MKQQLIFFLQLARVNSVLARRLSVHGLGFGEFMILYYLSEAPEGKLRRIDLADKIGLTASGITRMLIPMEKIGLIKRENDDLDGRARYSLLTGAGKRLFKDANATMHNKIDDILPSGSAKKLEEFTKYIKTLKTD